MSKLIADEALAKELEQKIRDMFNLEFQRNDINYALTGVERDGLTPKDITDDMSVALSNWFAKDLLPIAQQQLLAKLLEQLPEKSPIETVGKIVKKQSFNHGYIAGRNNVIDQVVSIINHYLTKAEPEQGEKG